MRTVLRVDKLASRWLFPSVVEDMAFMSCREVLKRLLFIVPCVASLVMFAIDFTGKQESPVDLTRKREKAVEGKAESKKPIIHNIYVVCDPQNLCDLSPCRYGGTCHPRTESDGTKSFVCYCPHGFGGRTCANILAEPRIDFEKGPTFVEENTTVTLPKCHVTGSPTPEVKWSKVGGRLPALSEVEDGQLKIVNATKQDAGQYKCEATNSVGYDAAETSVEVVEFVKPPEVLNTAAEGVIAAKCHVTTELKLQFAEWSKLNTKLFPLADGTLKLTVQEEDAGTYVCTVSVGNLKLVAEMQLNVLGPCRPVGVQDPSRIPDSSMTASSYMHNFTSPHHGRLHGTRRTGGWCPKTHTSTEYLQVDMGAQRTVCAVATQGLRKLAWTTRYKLYLSRDGATWSFYQENSAVKQFTGNSDLSTVVKHQMDLTPARYVRFYPLAFVYWPCLRVEIFAVCAPVGVQDPSRIPDSSMTASSYYDSGYYPHYGRLHGTRGRGAWYPKTPSSTAEYLQVDMGAQLAVCAVATQGGARGLKWTRQYKLSLSRDGVTWSFYKENNKPKEFPGNIDGDSVVRNYLSADTRYVRFYPVYYAWPPYLRVEVFVWE